MLVVKEIGTDKRLEIEDSGENRELNLEPDQFEAFCKRLYEGFHGIPEKVN